MKYVNVDIFLQGKLIENFKNMVLDEDVPDYFFDRINQGSRVVVAIDTLFQTSLPSTIARTALADSDGRPALATLKAGATDVVRIEAKRNGAGGNKTAVTVSDGRAGLPLTGAGNAPSIDIQAKQPGGGGTGIRASVVAAGPTTLNIVITTADGSRTLGPFATVDEIVKGLSTDPDVQAVAAGVAMPSPAAATPLTRRVDIAVITEGADTARYRNLASMDAIAGVSDPVVRFNVVGGATQLPDASTVRLGGGRNKGPALFLTGDASDQPLLEIVPAPNARGAISLSVTRGVSTVDNSTAVVNASVFVDDQEVETYANATMDPEDTNYLPFLLQSSALVRAYDLFVRTRSSDFPVNMSRPAALKGGASPLVDDYQDALDRLESAEDVDLVIASVANQLDDDGIRAAHKAVVAHCTKMADVARNRIGIGSVTATESKSVSMIVDHANDVRSEYFILCAPWGMEAAMAGLLSQQDYFQSPTFKTVSSPDGPSGQYTDSQLVQLIENNVVAINEKGKLGTIVVKGLLTSGQQINVQRTANKSVRDVKAICNVYIGSLNNEGARNALRQQIIAMFLQMEHDGAIVPSVDGKDPSHRVDVYSTEADFANGIVRVDIAVRPVRAIDYIYATILVKN